LESKAPAGLAAAAMPDNLQPYQSAIDVHSATGGLLDGLEPNATWQGSSAAALASARVNAPGQSAGLKVAIVGFRAEAGRPASIARCRADQTRN
jgi:hypothetical protein